MTKRLFSLILLITAMTTVVKAYDFEDGGLCYIINEDGESVTVTYKQKPSDNNHWTSYSHTNGSLTIPAFVTYNGASYTVTAISDYAFFNCNGFTGSLIIPNSVTTIGLRAFGGCSGFTDSLTIGNSVIAIGNNAFESCSGFSELNIGDSVTTIGEYAFRYCSGITDIKIPSNLADIGWAAFEETSWYNKQPEGIVYIGNVAYRYKGTVPKGATLTLREGIKGIASGAFDDCSAFIGSLTIPESVVHIGDKAFDDCCGFTGSLSIPSSVSTIGKSAFYRCNGFTELTIPNSVKTIDNYAFWGCDGFIGSLTIPESVTYIGQSAFDGCSGFTELNWNAKHCESLGDLPASGIERVTIGNQVEVIPNGFVRSSKVSELLIIPKSVITVGENAFQDCDGLTSVIWNSKSCNDFDYERRPFRDCSNISSFEFGNEVEHIPNNICCDMVNLRSLIIPCSVKTIGQLAFFQCSGLTNSLNIPNSVISIGNSAFCGCSGFNGSLIIPNSLSTIGDAAFSGCDGFISLVFADKGKYQLSQGVLPEVKDIFVSGDVSSLSGLNLSPSANVYSYALTPPECDAQSFAQYNAKLHVPQRATAAYFDAPYWNRFGNIVGDAVMPELLEVEQDSIVIKLGEQFYLEGIWLTPVNTGLKMSLESSNPDVATVREDENTGEYVIATYRAGETDIIARCAWLEARCHVTVVDAITLDLHELQMKAGTVASLMPYSQVMREFIASTSDRSVATARVINGCVQVAAVKPGVATIIVSDIDGKAQPDSCNVTVIRPIGDIDCDGFADVSDVNIIIDMVLGKIDVDLENADFDENGTIDVSDVNRMIDIVLGKYVPGETFIVNGVSFRMVGVEGGTFMMGASDDDSDASDSEKPTHQVTLASFAIGETEVTQELWVAVMGSNPSYFNGIGNPDEGSYHGEYNYGTNLQRPVECVSWDDCQTFISRLNQLTGRNFRLPTEAEWEYAARGGNKSQGFKYSGSNILSDVAWSWENIPTQNYELNGYGTQTVASKSPNELGLFDMSGNVLEWCQDWYGSYSNIAQTNPEGPASGSWHVYRGGCWGYSTEKSRLSWRGGGFSNRRDGGLGLRLAMR